MRRVAGHSRQRVDRPRVGPKRAPPWAPSAHRPSRAFVDRPRARSSWAELAAAVAVGMVFSAPAAPASETDVSTGLIETADLIDAHGAAMMDHGRRLADAARASSDPNRDHWIADGEHMVPDGVGTQALAGRLRNAARLLGGHPTQRAEVDLGTLSGEATSLIAEGRGHRPRTSDGRTRDGDARARAAARQRDPRVGRGAYGLGRAADRRRGRARDPHRPDPESVCGPDAAEPWPLTRTVVVVRDAKPRSEGRPPFGLPTGSHSADVWVLSTLSAAGLRFKHGAEPGSRPERLP